MKTFPAFLFIIVVLARPLSAEEQLLDRVVAVVEDEIITQSELDVMLRPLYEDYKKDYKGAALIDKLNEARERLLNQMIEDRLVYQAAQEEKIEIGEEEIEEQMQQFVKRFGSEPAMEEAMKEQGVTMEVLRDRIKRQATVQKMQTIHIRARVVVSPLEIEEYFKTHPSEFSEQEKIQVRSLTMKKNSEAREKGLEDEETKKKIENLRDKLAAGESFEELAKLYSEDTLAKEGGLGDWIRRGDMIREIESVIFNMKTGELSPVIETPMGYHLFRVENRETGKEKKLEEARDEIFKKLYETKYHERFKEWMAELKKNAYISIR